MSERMSNAPVYYALAQACFNPVAAMATYINQIQDRLRREGYPLFEKQEWMQLTMQGGAQAQPQPQRIERWLMIRSDRSAGFVIDTSAITYHTTNYQTHKEFITELLRGLGAVHEIVSLDHVSRLGLRYLDAILPQHGETVKQYLTGGVHGINSDAVCTQTMTESLFTTKTGPLVDEGNLVVRTYCRESTRLGLFPPDIRPEGLVVAPKFTIEYKDAREHAVIDTDHFVFGQMPLDMAELEKQLLSLRDAIKSVFEAVTTSHARYVWK